METKARDIMSKKIQTARDGMTVEEAIKLLVNKKVTGVPVTDYEGIMIGILSEYDILKQLSGSRIESKAFNKPIVYSRHILAVDQDTPLEAVVNEFLDKKVRRLPVTDRKGKLVGIITRRDLMRVYYYRSRLGSHE